MKRTRVVDIIKSFFTGVTWYLLVMHLSLFFIFTVLLLLVNEKTLLWASAEVITALLLAVFFAVMYKLIAKPLKEINKAARIMLSEIPGSWRSRPWVVNIKTYYFSARRENNDRK